MKKIIMLAFVLLGISVSLYAQHEHHNMPAKKDSTVEQKKTKKPKPTMANLS